MHYEIAAITPLRLLLRLPFTLFAATAFYIRQLICRQPYCYEI